VSCVLVLLGCVWVFCVVTHMFEGCVVCCIADVKTEMMKSQLPSSVLGKIYRLADVDQDGLLDADEFALMMHLISIKLDGYDLPSSLPSHLIPPSKREKVQPTSSVSEPAS